MKGLVCKKLGMTQLFDKTGKVLAVTVVEVEPNVIVQIKTDKTDKYKAIKVAVFDKKKNRTSGPEEGIFKKVNVSPRKVLKEFRVETTEGYTVGQELGCDIFTENEFVDVTAMTKGHGTSGAIKRWGSARGRMSHGAGPVHRAPGSLGAHTFPARVFKNKHMAGRYGNEKVTIKNLQIVKVDSVKNCLFIKGSVAGHKGSIVIVKGHGEASK
ncbi:MAG: 50S ribosomal protein L3 [Christensenellaceae bacterium]|nr:50S ribosomal protein L3 [Christensenellaceae bacterium]